jgi:hypothetical protein
VHKPDIPPLLEQTILQMLEKDPDRRPSLLNIRNAFAELVASGAVPIEAGSTGMFRSDLARRRGESEIRTPRSSPSNGASPELPHAGTNDTSARRRSPRPSEQPTAINFTPGLDTLVPSEHGVTSFHEVSLPRSSRRTVVLGLLILLVGAGAGIAAITMVKKKPATAPSDAGSAAVARPATAPADALVLAEAPDAAPIVPADAEVPAGSTGSAAETGSEIAKRAIEVRVAVATATVEIDGARVDAPGGVAKIALGDGEHLVIAKASGYVTASKTVVVAADHTSFVIRLERARRTTHSTGKGAAAPVNGKDATVDPFAD